VLSCSFSRGIIIDTERTDGKERRGGSLNLSDVTAQTGRLAQAAVEEWNPPPSTFRGIAWGGIQYLRQSSTPTMTHTGMRPNQEELWIISMDNRKYGQVKQKS